MSVNQNSSGDEGALCIDTERKSGAEKSKGKSGKKKGHGKGKGAAKGKGKGANKNGVQESKDLKAGDVVWAKVPGFNHWPAKIFNKDDDIVPVWLKVSPKPDYMLVRFFGTYDMQWLSPNVIETYTEGRNRGFAWKSRSRLFLKAVQEVFEYMENSVLPEGLTKIPPYPVDAGMTGVIKEGGVVKQVPIPFEPQPSEVESDPDESDPEECDPVVAECDPVVEECGPAKCDPGPTNGPTYTRSSSRRKSTPRHWSSSSSESKRARLDSAAGEGQGQEERNLPSPEIQAFTSAPLPTTKPTEPENPPTTET